LQKAQANLPNDHTWTQRARQVQKQTLDSIRRFGKGIETFDQQAALRELSTSSRNILQFIAICIRKLVLTASGDDLRQRLYREARFESLAHPIRN